LCLLINAITMIDKSTSYILCLNGGSSSLKFSLYNAGSIKAELQGSVDRIGADDGKMEIKSQDHFIFKGRETHYINIVDAAKAVIGWLKGNRDHFSIIAIGHRLVQGGPEHLEPKLITNDLLKSLHKYIYLAPNHLPGEIGIIKAFRSAFRKVPQVACFDTSFHRHMPPQAKYYPLPIEYREKGLIRYGFHGLSYGYIMEKLAERNRSLSKKKIIIAHLGNGASMAAVKNLVSIDTTMGISPDGGLVMGTRSGDLDPGVPLFLLNQAKLSTDELNDLMSKQSGLKAIAGISDVQQLLKNEGRDPKAKEALTLFCYQAKKFIGALAAAMSGLDMLVFTGGIGENSAVIRERICDGLDFMGITIDKLFNNHGHETISSATGHVKVSVIKTDEEWMIARLVCNVLNFTTKQ